MAGQRTPTAPFSSDPHASGQRRPTAPFSSDPHASGQRRPTAPFQPAPPPPPPPPPPQQGAQPPPPPPPPQDTPRSAAQSWTPTSQPGYGERYWNQTQNRWQQPGAASQYWQGQQGNFANPTQYETNVGNYANQMGQQPGAMENLYNEYQAQGAFTNPGDAERWWQENQGQYGQPGSMEEFYAQHGQTLTGPGALEQGQGDVMGEYGRANNMDQFWSQTQGQLGGPGYAEKYAQGYSDKPSFMEDFLTGGGAGEGLNKLYDRMYSTNAGRLDKAAAARGGFNSGAALRAQAEMGADLGAQQVRDMLEASKQADVSKDRRQRLGMDIMGTADKGTFGRLGLGYEGASRADSTALDRARGKFDMYAGMSDEKRNNLEAAGTFANNAQTSQFDRLDDARQGAEGSQDRARDRYNAGVSAADRAQRSGMDRLKDAAGLDKDANDMMFGRINDGGNLANNADVSDLNRLTGGQVAASSAQRDQQNRENDVFNNTSRLGGMQADTYGSGMDAIRNEERQFMMDQINGDITSGRLTAEQIQAKYGAKMETLGLMINAAGMVVPKPGAAGNPAPSGGAPPVGVTSSAPAPSTSYKNSRPRY